MNIFGIELGKWILPVLVTGLVACGGGGGDSDSSSESGSGSTNNRPTISGSPASAVTAGQTYSFTPQANDSDGDSLSFNIVNAPEWATFNTANGRLNGAPQLSDVGAHPNILISVSDGTDSASLSSFTIIVSSNSGTQDTDNDGLTDAEELAIGTHPGVSDTDGDGFLDKEEVDNWDQFSGTHLRFNPLVADVPRLRMQRLGTPVIQLYATTTESGSINKGMTEESVAEVQTTTDRGRESINVIEEQHAVNVNAEVKKSGPVTTGSVEASYDYNHTDTTTETNFWNETTVETNRQASSEYYETLNSESVTESGGEIKVLMGLLNDGDISYTLSNMNISAFMANPERPGDLIAVGTLLFDGDMTFTPSPLGTNVQPSQDDFTPFNFVYRAENNPEEISRILENSNQLVFEATNLSLTGQRQDVDLNLAAQNVRARTAEVIVDFGDSQGIKTERHRVAVENGTGPTLSFDELMSQRLNFSYQFSTESFPGFDSNNGLTAIRNVVMDAATNSYWLVAHTFTPVGAPSGTTETRLYNILNENYAASDLELRKGDVLHLAYITDSDLDGLSDRLEIIEGTDSNLSDTDSDGLDDAFEKYGWFSNLSQAPCDQGEELFLVFSNPLDPDTDSDGITDLDEFNNCTNPNGDLKVAAGEDRVVSINGSITLTAEPENFRDRNSLSYIWTQTGGVSIGALPNTASITFDAPAEVTNLQFNVSVTDTDLQNSTASDSVSVFVALDRSNAVFVDADVGHDFNNTGTTPDSPLETIERSLSAFPGNDIYLNTPDGGFFELAETLVLPAGASIFGGFDQNWTHDPDSSPTPIMVDDLTGMLVQNFSSTIISGISIEAKAPSASEGHTQAIIIANGDDITLDRVSAKGADLPSDHVDAGNVAASSYGVFVSQVDRLDIIQSNLFAGNAASGSQGRAGADGARGDAGSNGTGGGTGGGGGSGHNGANGGNGASSQQGATACTDGSNGSKGGNSGSISGGSGGSGADATFKFPATCSVSRSGINGGSVFTRAAFGSQGAGADHSLVFNSGLFVPADGKTDGGKGPGGAGGGGGGAGAGIDLNNGGGGGGGGEGGEGGDGGTAGKGAAGSFGLLLSDVVFARIVESQIQSANGGLGGAGGAGGTGGAGGSGGSGGDSGSRQGGSGGSGAPGGFGGSGGGGAGGPVAAVVLLGSQLDVTDSQIVTGNAGNGINPNRGQGGWNYGIFTDDSSGIGANVDNAFTLGTAGNRADPSAETN